MTMEFKKYNSIENSYQEIFSEFEGKIFEEDTEQEFLEGDVKYHLGYSSNIVTENYKDKISALYTAVSKQFDTKTVTIFGELFGGGYPHPDVPKDDNAKL